MKRYHKIKLQELLKYFNPFNVSFMENKEIINIEMINKYYCNSSLFLDDEDSIVIQSEFDNETLCWLKKIIFEIHNPRFMHDGNIKIEVNVSQPYINVDSVVYGIEKIISALYHKEEYIIVQMSNTSLFSDISSYNSLKEINYHFTKFPISEEIKDASLMINYSDTLDLEYVSVALQEDVVENWNSKEYIIKQVKEGRDNIKHFIPEVLLNDDDFMLSLFLINKNTCWWIDAFSPRWLTLLEKLHDASDELLAYVLLSVCSNEYLYLYYHNVDHTENRCTNLINYDSYPANHPCLINYQNVNKYFFGNKTLVKFILTNPLFTKEYSYSLRVLVNLLPEEIINDEEMINIIIPYLTINTFKKCSPNYFKSPEFLGQCFTSFNNLKFDENIKNFFTKNRYTYESWHKDKTQALILLKNITYESNRYTNHEMVKFIFSLLSNQLQDDNDIIVQLISINDKMIYAIPSKKCYEPQIMNYYLQYGDVSSMVKMKSRNCNQFCYTNADFFKQKDLDIIKHICSKIPELVYNLDAPESWRNNLELAYIDPHYFINNFSLYSTVVQNAILDNSELFNKWFTNYPDLYEQLPLYMQENENFALYYAKSRTIKLSPKKFPIKLLLNMDFCFKLLAISLNNIVHIPKIIRDNTYFIQYVFYAAYESEYNRPILNKLKEYYPEIFKLFDHLKPEYIDEFFTHHFKNQYNYKLYQQMKKRLATNNTKKEITKI